MTRLVGTVLRKLPLPMSLLVDRISFELPRQVSDGAGGYTPGWDDLVTNVRCLIVDSSPPSGALGGQVVALGGLGEHVTHRIWMRADPPGLTSKCRARTADNSKHFRIHDVARYGGNVMVQAEEVR